MKYYLIELALTEEAFVIITGTFTSINLTFTNPSFDLDILTITGVITFVIIRSFMLVSPRVEDPYTYNKVR